MLYYISQFQNINLIYKKKNGENEEYASRVISLDSEIELMVENPSKEGKEVRFLNGTRLDVVFQVENHGLHSFETEIVAKVREKINLLKLRRLGEVKKLQRRNFYRVKSDLDVIVRRLGDVIFEETIILDISGGGLKFLSRQDFKLGDLVELNITLLGEDLDLEAKVVKVDKIGFGKSEVSVEFYDLYEDDQNVIVKYVFEKQRREIKRRNNSK
ncbi:flagellar brake protein [Criibacterium bergeronii]|uniref:Flagellar brake protein n=1 Tax=Criibacterium bergeronii TaxID=1871336 RepID=A0A371IMP1_9FIRM|nr:PilZ domain-containing protein [Criibacterium bergeronii]MBS6062372.1 PilZ domain-containing protein [Peptostreptococcaceae bacterium]RDY21720.1 flagellar brake protein [Criibacterium bergeronii]